MSFLEILLFPLSMIYHLIVTIRKVLYKIGFFKTYTFSIPLISVGNLSLGGSGKTPHVEYLIRMLSSYKIVTLSRGYKRKSRGFILASERISPTAELIGDEPFQYYKKYSPVVSISVGEDRVKSILKIQKKLPATQIVLLDDAFQQIRLKVTLNILLTTFDKPFFKDFVVPSGRLREGRSGAKRADAVIITKCPVSISTQDKNSIKKNVLIYTNKNTPVYFTSVRYANPVAIFNNTTVMGKNIILFAGIADLQPFKKYMEDKYTLSSIFQFPDHHHYLLKEIISIIKAYEKIQGTDKCIVTTEKDMVKLLEEPFKSLLMELPIFYVPIEVFFIEKEKEFSQLVMGSIKKYNN